MIRRAEDLGRKHLTHPIRVQGITGLLMGVEHWAERGKKNAVARAYEVCLTVDERVVTVAADAEIEFL